MASTIWRGCYRKGSRAASGVKPYLSPDGGTTSAVSIRGAGAPGRQRGRVARYGEKRGVHGLLDALSAGPLLGSARSDRGADGRGGRDGQAAGRLARVRQRLPPPDRSRQGGGNHRPSVRRQVRPRIRRGLDDLRLRKER